MIAHHQNTAFALLLVQVFTTFAMAGVIWQVQLVTYPQFAEVDAISFSSYHFHYSRRITFLVGPLMVLELLSACLFAGVLFYTRLRVPGILGAVLAIGTWAVTGLVQVPLHEKLASGKDFSTIETLVSGNWIRVALWTARSLLISVILITVFRNSALSALRESGE